MRYLTDRNLGTGQGQLTVTSDESAGYTHHARSDPTGLEIWVLDMPRRIASMDPLVTRKSQNQCDLVEAGVAELADALA